MPAVLFVRITSGLDAEELDRRLEERRPRFRDVPGLVLSERMQQRYPGLLCDLAQGMFQVDNPRPKPGLRKLLRKARRTHGVRVRDLVKDGIAAMRSFS